MNELFANFAPQAWFDEAGLRKSAKSLGMSSTATKRIRRWRNTVKGVSLSIAMSAALTAASLSVPAIATASNGLDIPVPVGMTVVPAPSPQASVGEINESFAALFAAMRSSTKLIPNDHTRQLADEAAARRNDRPDDWAKKLALDVRNAND